MALDLAPIGRALISVSDKTGLVELGKALEARGIELVSTGGTAAALAKAGLEVVDVAKLTGFPEMMDGRLKTLHPRVHGGLLAIRGEPAHQAAMIANGIAPIDLLVVNLYPFEDALRRAAPFDEMIENIDIGGPAMIRAAAKNHADVAVIVDVADYARLLEEMAANGGATRLAFRRALAQKAFARTAAYDSAIANWFAREIGETAPAWRTFGGKLASALRYGENPHQRAAFYVGPESRPGVATARQLQGKELSYNNLNDTDAAFELVAEFAPEESAAAAIIKHANPCGVAVGATLLEAYEKALSCDPVSAYGGVVALNRTLDAAAARKIVEIFTEVIIAPAVDDEAAGDRRDEEEPAPARRRRPARSARADRRACARSPAACWCRTATRARSIPRRSRSSPSARRPRPNSPISPSPGGCASTSSRTRSSTRATARPSASAPGRCRASIPRAIAARKAEDAARAAGWPAPRTQGSVVASDAFFPFADGLVAAIEAGATAVIQPGGSMRDAEVIAAADAAGIAMVFTGMRHFRH